MKNKSNTLTLGPGGPGSPLWPLKPCTGRETKASK